MTLQELRESLQLTQRELGRRAGLPASTVGQIENGTNANPSVAVCLALVEALKRSGAPGVSVDTLFSSYAREGEKVVQP
jgi:transcriptional regulator with XRE-family HTH domain